MTAAGVRRTCYYLTFCRMPTLGLEEWKSAFRDFADDEIDLVVLWLGGGFASRKYPITWQYNASHLNVQEDFVKDLIDYAHTLGIKVLLGFTPYNYDGTNQYYLERPDLKGTQAGGTIMPILGIHSWGYALDPSKEDARTFMLEYARELYFDFYPNADGLMIESADIEVPTGGGSSGTRYYELEYDFAKQLSDEVWAQDPDAEIIVYPHYFKGKGLSHEWDDRWTLTFNDWAAPLDAELIAQASKTLYFDLNLVHELPLALRDSMRKVRANGVQTYGASHEFFTFDSVRPEFLEWANVNRALRPFGFDQLERDKNPYSDPIIAVNRVALREFARDPDLGVDAFREALGRALLDTGGTDKSVDDLLYLHECYYWKRTFFQAGPVADPRAMHDLLERGKLTFDDLARIGSLLDGVPAVRDRLRAAEGERARSLAAHAEYILAAWSESDRTYLRRHYEP